MAREEAKARRDALVAALEDKVRMIDRVHPSPMQTRLCAANHFKIPSLFMIGLARIVLCEPSRRRCSRSWPERRFASKLCVWFVSPAITHPTVTESLCTSCSCVQRTQDRSMVQSNRDTLLCVSCRFMLMQARLAASERVRREHEFEKQALRRKIETDALKIEALADMRHAMYVDFLPINSCEMMLYDPCSLVGACGFLLAGTMPAWQRCARSALRWTVGGAAPFWSEPSHRYATCHCRPCDSPYS
jgi:hypothetical protein